MQSCNWAGLILLIGSPWTAYKVFIPDQEQIGKTRPPEMMGRENEGVGKTTVITIIGERTFCTRESDWRSRGPCGCCHRKRDCESWRVWLRGGGYYVNSMPSPCHCRAGTRRPLARSQRLVRRLQTSRASPRIPAGFMYRYKVCEICYIVVVPEERMSSALLVPWGRNSSVTIA